MPMTKEERDAWERQNLGCTLAELKEINLFNGAGQMEVLMLAASILSDIQEVASIATQETPEAANRLETIRKFANRSKALIFEVTADLRKSER